MLLKLFQNLQLPLMRRTHHWNLRNFQNFHRSSKIQSHTWPGRRDLLLHRCHTSRSSCPEGSKVIPKLVYLHNPWKYFVTKWNLWKLKLLWDRQFVEREFIRGSKQAAVLMTNIIRTNDSQQAIKFTTPLGFQQIARDMILSRDDFRLRLVKFRTEDFRRAIPMKVIVLKRKGRKHCVIDMLFVGMRNVKDFDHPQELRDLQLDLHKFDAKMGTQSELLRVPHRIVFAEIFIRFYRDYTNWQSDEKEDQDWSVAFYKIISFNVLNYDPK